jgi:hypothetical protein
MSDLNDGTSVAQADRSANAVARTASRPPPPRQCGRCRLEFPGDPSLDPSRAPTWWACPPCHAALFPDYEGTYSRWQRGATSTSRT